MTLSDTISTIRSRPSAPGLIGRLTWNLSRVEFEPQRVIGCPVRADLGAPASGRAAGWWIRQWRWR